MCACAEIFRAEIYISKTNSYNFDQGMLEFMNYVRIRVRPSEECASPPLPRLQTGGYKYNLVIITRLFEPKEFYLQTY